MTQSAQESRCCTMLQRMETAPDLQCLDDVQEHRGIVPARVRHPSAAGHQAGFVKNRQGDG